MVALKDPANIGIDDRVMAIPGKRTVKPLISEPKDKARNVERIVNTGQYL